MGMMKGEKPRDFKGTARKLFQYLGSYRAIDPGRLAVCHRLNRGCHLWPNIMGKATTALFNGVMAQTAGTGSIDFTYIGQILLFALMLYIVSAMLSFVQGWIMSNVAMDITYQFRKDISEKINRMPFKYFDGTNHGEVFPGLPMTWIPSARPSTRA